MALTYLKNNLHSPFVFNRALFILDFSDVWPSVFSNIFFTDSFADNNLLASLWTDTLQNKLWETAYWCCCGKWSCCLFWSSSSFKIHTLQCFKLSFSLPITRCESLCHHTCQTGCQLVTRWAQVEDDQQLNVQSTALFGKGNVSSNSNTVIQILFI